MDYLPYLHKTLMKGFTITNGYTNNFWLLEKKNSLKKNVIYEFE